MTSCIRLIRDHWPAARRLGAFLLLAGLPLAALGKPPTTDESFRVAGVKIHYVVRGEGEPVVLIHGLNASILLNWQLTGVMGLLSKHYRVIGLDLPGHGESDRPENEAAYGVQMVEDVRQLLDHLKIKKAHIVGYSLGGAITLKFLSMHQDRVRSAILGGMGWMAPGSGVQKLWELIGERQGARSSNPCVRSVAALAVPPAALKAIHVPVEIIIGDRDPIRPLYVAPLAPVRRDWPVVDIPDAGHVTCVLNPQFKVEIKKWLDGHAGHVK
jgi:pimeloyl-ACP methyl ester carboxylesterase